ncbi:MAG: hypothetical protein KF729_32495 [Sandaracinaceae bacterium]|nr:hypothetical protein [Sandaracinaceae bacterium]
MRALEPLLLLDASRASAELGEARRRAAAGSIDASARDAGRAETLWASGARASAYGYAERALDRALEAAAHAGVEDEALSRLLGERWAGRVERARAAACLPAPRSDDELADHHAELYAERLACAGRLAGALEHRTWAPDAIARARWVRWAVGLGVAALFAAFALYQIRFEPPRPQAEASAYRTVDVVQTWPPENAVDRDEMSYWHLPPGETGWLELTLSPPRDVSALRVMNAHDLHADDQNRYDRRRFDHASRAIVVRAYAGGREVAATEYELTRLRALDRDTIPLEARGVERIRIEVTSFWGAGGGLAEVEVLP